MVNDKKKRKKKQRNVLGKIQQFAKTADSERDRERKHMNLPARFK